MKILGVLGFGNIQIKPSCKLESDACEVKSDLHYAGKDVML